MLAPPLACVPGVKTSVPFVGPLVWVQVSVWALSVSLTRSRLEKSVAPAFVVSASGVFAPTKDGAVFGGGAVLTLATVMLLKLRLAGSLICVSGPVATIFQVMVIDATALSANEAPPFRMELAENTLVLPGMYDPLRTWLPLVWPPTSLVMIDNALKPWKFSKNENARSLKVNVLTPALPPTLIVMLPLVSGVIWSAAYMRVPSTPMPLLISNLSENLTKPAPPELAGPAAPPKS